MVDEPVQRFGMVVVQTASGSTYEIDWDNMRLRRVPRSAQRSDDFECADLRRDGSWVTVLEVRQLAVGQSASFVLEPLGDRRWVYATHRTTTPVQTITPVRVAA